MPDYQGTTRAQTIFLRAFRDHPFGPPPQLWPSPAILRKWLRKPSFRAAFLSLRQALNYRSDFHLASAAANAALSLTSHDLNPEHESMTPQALSPLLSLLRLSHVRQRFSPDPPPPDPSIRKQRKDDLDYILDLLNSLPNHNAKLVLHLYNQAKEKRDALARGEQPTVPTPELRPVITPDFFEASDDPDEN